MPRGTSTVDGGRSTVHQDGDDGLNGFLRCSAGHTAAGV